MLISLTSPANGVETMNVAPKVRKVMPTSLVDAPTETRCGSNIETIIPLQKNVHRLSTNGMKMDGNWNPEVQTINDLPFFQTHQESILLRLFKE